MSLTKKQKILLDYVDGFVKSHDYSPTYREIMHALDYKSVSTVAKHIDNLVVLGRLVKREGEARSLVVVSGDQQAGSTDSLKHQEWLRSLVDKKLSSPATSTEDSAIIERAMKLLGLDDSSK